MKVIYRKTSIQIVPENDQDEVYLESVLNVKKAGELCQAKRIPPLGLEYSWAYLELKKF